MMMTSSGSGGGGGGGTTPQAQQRKRQELQQRRAMLSSMLEGSFDAGFIVDEASGRICYANQAAVDLFDVGSRAEFFPNISDFIQFWAHTLKQQQQEQQQQDGGGDLNSTNSNSINNNSINNNRQEDDEKSASVGGALNASFSESTDAEGLGSDHLSWTTVIQEHAKTKSTAATTATADNVDQKETTVRKWTITGTKMGHSKSLQQQQQQQPQAGDDNASKSSSPSVRFGTDETSCSDGASSSAAPSTAKRTFPGVLLLTPAYDEANSNNNNLQQGEKVWMVYVRHADHHDIIQVGATNGSLSQSEKHSGVRRRNDGSSSSFGRRRKGVPSITIDETGTIVDIDVPNAVLLRRQKLDKSSASQASSSTALLSGASNKNQQQPPTQTPDADTRWDWVSKDLIGKHITQAHPPEPTQEDTKAAKEAAAQQLPPGTVPKRKPGQSMLDVILENRMDPGHPSVPFSGYALRTHTYDTAMTTGNAIREENITEAAFEAALDPIFQIDEHGTIQMVNSAATRLFGWKRAEFVGSNISMICGGGHGAHHAKYMARYLATGETRVIGKNRQLQARKKDGREFPIELGVVEVDTFAGDVRLFCGFVRDLTDLVARERLAQEIVEVAQDPMFQINQHGIILMVNKAALTTFGYAERSELVGKNVSIICGGSHGVNHDVYLGRYMRTGKANLIGQKYRELPAKRKDGSEFIIQLAVVEIQAPTNSSKNDDDSEDEPERRFVGFIHDLSSQKRDHEIMRATVDTSYDPVLHINENGIIQMVNQAATKHLGYTREELVGENVSLIVGGDEHARNHGKYMERYLRTGERRVMGQKRRFMARRKDGSEMKIELGVSEILINGGRHGEERIFCAFLTDLSSRTYTPEPQPSVAIPNNGAKKIEFGPTHSSPFWIKVSEEIPTLEQCYTFCAAETSCGAVSTFVGITRDNFQGKSVRKLSYEGYKPMAEKELLKLCQEATSSGKYPNVKRIAAVHVVGDCPVGQASVILAASSPHRREAIQCCEFLIDELKARIPVWKLEVYEGDEGSVWKENVEWHEGKQKRVMVKQEPPPPPSGTS
mmetsp:Transcript_25293/g.59223  ORF Transcript_25293/g.59223 Transcript_25293/m.59223 type:complete len:1061 (-) Transcript_25293:101-3283(-)